MPRAEVNTYFTRADGETHLLYDPREQITLRLELETAGPVAVGTREELGPVLSGKGILLTTGDPQEFVLSLGDRMFIIAETTDRVKVVAQPVPYLPEIAVGVHKLAGTKPGDLGPPPPAAPPVKPGAIQRGTPKRPVGAPRPKLGRRDRARKRLW